MSKINITNYPVIIPLYQFADNTLGKLARYCTYQMVSLWKGHKVYYIPQKNHPLTEVFKKERLTESFKNECPKLYHQIKITTGATLDQKIETVVHALLDQLSDQEKNKIYGALYQSVNPITEDPNWGKNHAKDTENLSHLIKILGERGHLEKKGSRYKVFSFGEKTKASTYVLNQGYSHAKGKVGYINGLGTKQDSAKWDAQQFSKDFGITSEISGIYNPTQGGISDAIHTIPMQGGMITAPVKLLVDEWIQFLNQAGDDQTYVQICYSQSAIHVRQALLLLPKEQRRKIFVIAIAPAVFFDEDLGCRAHHFVKKSDTYFYMNLKGKKNVCIVPEETHLRSDGKPFDHHDPHTPNYTAAIKPWIEKVLA
jgi:hypothetical protein